MSADAYCHLALCAIALVACTLDPEVCGEARRTFLAYSCLSLSSLNLVRYAQLLVVFLQEPFMDMGFKSEGCKERTSLRQKSQVSYLL